jgi:hypothetical protein
MAEKGRHLGLTRLHTRRRWWDVARVGPHLITVSDDLMVRLEVDGPHAGWLDEGPRSDLLRVLPDDLEGDSPVRLL